MRDQLDQLPSVPLLELAVALSRLYMLQEKPTTTRAAPVEF